MALVSIFQASDFDLLSTGVFSQELSFLQHKYNASVGQVFTIKGEPDQHFRFDKADRSPAGEIAGRWYEEIGGVGKVLIVND